jgi:CheY-like chemotaxis protein
MTKILIIDDEPAVVDVLEKILQRAGHSVASARDGTAGLKSQDQNPADVVIADIMMPRVNGVQVIESLRRTHPATRIIAISGGGNFGPLGYRSEAITTTAYLAAAEKAGADAILTKPFDREELLETVKRLGAA